MIPHGGGLERGRALHHGDDERPWAEMFMPAPGGPKEVYDIWEERYNLTKGPEGIYMRPSDKPGFGWDIVVT